MTIESNVALSSIKFDRRHYHAGFSWRRGVLWIFGRLFRARPFHWQLVRFLLVQLARFPLERWSKFPDLCRRRSWSGCIFSPSQSICWAVVRTWIRGVNKGNLSHSLLRSKAAQFILGQLIDELAYHSATSLCFASEKWHSKSDTISHMIGHLFQNYDMYLFEH